MQDKEKGVPEILISKHEADFENKHYVYFEAELGSASAEMTRLIEQTYRDQGEVLGVLVTSGTEARILFSSEAPHHSALEASPRGIGFNLGATFEYCNTPDVSNILVVYGFTEQETEPLELLKFIVKSWPLSVVDAYVDASIDGQGLKSLAKGNIAAISRFLKKLES